MIEENARIVSIEGDVAWVETYRKTTCGSCSAKQSCGSSLLEQFFGQRSTQIEVSLIDGVSEGDEVVLGLDESSLMHGSFVVYMLPVLLMLLMAAMMPELLSDDWMSAEAASIFGGLSGLGVGLLWLKAYAKRALMDDRFRPVLLRRVGGLLQPNLVNKIIQEI